MKILNLFLAVFLTVFTVGPAFAQYSPDPSINLALSQSLNSPALESEDDVELPAVTITAKDMLVTDGTVTAPSEEKIEPVLVVVKYAIEALNKLFPKQAKNIQLVLEIIASIATFFTALTMFAITILKIPLVVARVSKANELADKIQKFYDKWIPILKKASIFNAPTKK